MSVFWNCIGRLKRKLDRNKRRVADLRRKAQRREADVAQLKAPTRVLYVLWHYPQLSETYVETEIQCMLRWGVHIEVWRTEIGASAYPSSVKIHDGAIEDAVREAKPEVIHVHWLSWALTQEKLLASLGIPVAVRLHGFDVTQEALETLLSKPWVSRVYAYPSQAALLNRHDARVVVVPVTFDSGLFRPNRNKDRWLVARATAALPSKDAAFFFELARMLPRFRFVYAGVTCKHVESYVDTLKELRNQMQSPVELLFDLPRGEVADLIGRAGTFVHTACLAGSANATPLGMPTSIAEAMATGAYTLARATPEFEAYLGNAGATYRDLDEAADLITKTVQWTDEDWETAQTRAIERAYGNYADELVLRTIFEDWHRLIQEKPPSEPTPKASVRV